MVGVEEDDGILGQAVGFQVVEDGLNLNVQLGNEVMIAGPVLADFGGCRGGRGGMEVLAGSWRSSLGTSAVRW